MQRKIFIVVMVIFFLFLIFPIYSRENFSVEYRLCMLDGFKHTPREFSYILAKILRYHPTYTREEIGEMIITTYYKIKSYIPKISVYKIAQGIERFSQDNLGIDLKNLVIYYIYSQMNR